MTTEHLDLAGATEELHSLLNIHSYKFKSHVWPVRIILDSTAFILELNRVTQKSRSRGGGSDNHLILSPLDVFFPLIAIWEKPVPLVIN